MANEVDNPAFTLFYSYWSWQVPAWALVTRFAREVHGLSLPPDKKKAAAIMDNKERTTDTAAQMAELVHNNTGVAVAGAGTDDFGPDRAGFGPDRGPAVDL